MGGTVKVVFDLYKVYTCSLLKLVEDVDPQSAM